MASYKNISNSNYCHNLQPILGEFNKEQEAFIKDQSGKNTEAGVCPWIGHKNEDKIKEEVFSLSSVSSKSGSKYF